MRLISTRPPFQEVSLRQAVLEDPSPDGALCQPIELPRLSVDELRALASAPFREVAEALALRILQPTVSAEALREIVSGAFTFPVPLVQLDEKSWVLELFHGPTGSFKDFGARFLARLLSVLRRPGEGPIVILVATSGDTGGAVAHAVRGLEGVKAVVLYPRGRMSSVQLEQLQEAAAGPRNEGEGVTPVEVLGTFDDCQRMVKEILARPGDGIGATLTSANSVNVGRLLPQSFYYVYGWGALPREAQDALTVSVPSGNLGNLTAGVLASQMGVPFEHFIAASNANAAMSRFYESGALPEGPSLMTVASAMDVSRPSNLERLLTMYERDIPTLRDRVSATTHEDPEIMSAMSSVLKDRGYLMDPHTAVGYLGLQEVRNSREAAAGLILSTADPAKFPETIVKITGGIPAVREDWQDDSGARAAAILEGEAATVRMEPDTEALRALLRKG
jgi:threonine synthase